MFYHYVIFGFMKYSNVVKYWLFLGLFLIFMQIVIGGITRLTGSGLSITEWDIVIGTFPPLTQVRWASEFEKYQQTPQYKKINQGMSLDQFKFIYFWEYIHRLWARLMGFCFIIPFVIFWWRGKIDFYLTKRLAVVIAFAVLAAVFGWIMVSSGLIDRPWVNAYKLSVHLSIGIAVFIALLWCVMECFYRDKWQDLKIKPKRLLETLLCTTFVLICIQIILGGIVSGMKAALPYPTWPDMNGAFIPKVLRDAESWQWSNLTEYEKSPFAAAFFQFAHRSAAYGLIVLSLLLYLLFRKKDLLPFSTILTTFIALIGIQVLLGILTLINSVGSVPVGLGVFHQGAGVLVLASFFTLFYAYTRASRKYELI